MTRQRFRLIIFGRLMCSTKPNSDLYDLLVLFWIEVEVEEADNTAVNIKKNMLWFIS